MSGRILWTFRVNLTQFLHGHTVRPDHHEVLFHDVVDWEGNSQRSFKRSRSHDSLDST